jgi:hypothetical protein
MATLAVSTIKGVGSEVLPNSVYFLISLKRFTNISTQISA